MLVAVHAAAAQEQRTHVAMVRRPVVATPASGCADVSPWTVRERAAVLIIHNGSVALIRRDWDGRQYYLFPGGGVDDGETSEEAAVREAREELGWNVELRGLVAECEIPGRSVQRYYAATVTDGEFGSGDGVEMSFLADGPDGSHTPVLIPMEQLLDLDVRPRDLACRLAEQSLTSDAVFVFTESIA